jgi:hypothetical protein
MKIVYLGQETAANQPFFTHLQDKAKLLTCAEQQDELQSILSCQIIDAVIGPEDQLDLMKSVIRKFPSINYALISSLAADDFHEVTEGYGFFMQLPPAPQQEDAEQFIRLLTAITTNTGIPAGKRQIS